MKKIMKVLCVFSAIILLTVIITFVDSNFCGYDSNTDIEVTQKIAGNGIEACETIIYKYETTDAEILLYQGASGMPFNCTLKKRNTNGQTKYKVKQCSTSGLDVFWDEWYEVNSHLRYTILKNPEDIVNYDCGKYQPIKTEINYTSKTGEKRIKYVYVIDEKNEGTPLVYS